MTTLKNKYFNASKIAESIGDSKSPIKNYVNNNPGTENYFDSQQDYGISNAVQNSPQGNQGQTPNRFAPPKTVNENEVFGGLPKAPEGGMPPFGTK